MKRLLALFAFSAVAALAQTPTITAVLNNYGRIPENASNYGIAQGSLFIVKGTNLSSVDTTLQDVTPGLQTTLQGVQIRINITGGGTVFTPLYYVLTTQLAGVLPSSVPPGNHTLTVIRNGLSSAPKALKVVKSAFGVLAFEFETGTGRAIVQALPTYALLGSDNSTNPGKDIIFYGSGLGPTAGADETRFLTPRDMTEITFTATIGGKPAQVTYHGRTIYPGLDQINIKAPTLDANAYGCDVPVIITSDGVAANPVTIPVMATAAVCANPNNGGGGGNNSGVSMTQSEINGYIAAGSYTHGTVGLGRATGHSYDALGALTTTKQDSVSAEFTRIGGADLGRFLRGEFPPGYAQYVPILNQCIVYTTIPSDPYPLLTRTWLDAGPSISSNGPNGTQIATKLVQQNVIQYSAANVPNTYMAAGNYTLTGTGGPQVGAFSGTLSIENELRVTDAPDTFKTITRTNGVTLHWTGGDPSTPVSISGLSFNLINNSVPGTPVLFICLVPNTGSYTIAASVLNQLPPSPAISAGGFSIVFRGSLSVSATNKGNRISIPGIDYGTTAAQWSTAYTPEYK